MAHKPDDELDELLRQIGDVVAGGKKEEPTAQPVRNFSNGYGARRKPGAAPIPAYNPDYEAARRAGAVPHGDRDQYDDGYDEDQYEDQYEDEYTDEPEDDWGYAEEVYDEYKDSCDPHEDDPDDSPRPRKTKKSRRKRRGCGCTTFLLLLAALVVGLCVLLFAMVRPPRSDEPIGTRKSGAVTILLCGTDVEGSRTDTMILLYINAKENAVNLVSLPRDTLTHTTAGKNAKLNSAFGRNNGKEDPAEGMDNLMDYVSDIIGYRPDGYMLISIEGFVDIVDAMGGVEFDVPQDMYYSDPTQDLFIDLEAGLQTLSGYDAMCLARFRKGYSDQDLGRVSVQRQLLTACMDQWMTISNVGKLPEALSALKTNCTTDLSTGNLLWLALNAWRAGFGNMQTATLPGYATSIGGGAYYVLKPGEVAETVNDLCNPYDVTITKDDLNIIH